MRKGHSTLRKGHSVEQETTGCAGEQRVDVESHINRRKSCLKQGICSEESSPDKHTEKYRNASHCSHCIKLKASEKPLS